jgi:hypothetical protein
MGHNDSSLSHRGPAAGVPVICRSKKNPADAGFVSDTPALKCGDGFFHLTFGNGGLALLTDADVLSVKILFVNSLDTGSLAKGTGASAAFYQFSDSAASMSLRHNHSLWYRPDRIRVIFLFPNPQVILYGLTRRR